MHPLLGSVARAIEPFAAPHIDAPPPGEKDVVQTTTTGADVVELLRLYELFAELDESCYPASEHAVRRVMGRAVQGSVEPVSECAARLRRALEAGTLCDKELHRFLSRVVADGWAPLPELKATEWKVLFALVDAAGPVGSSRIERATRVNPSLP